MKFKFTFFLILILSLPQTSVAQNDCQSDNGTYFSFCYDPDLDISVGDKFLWEVSEYLENGQPVDYGIESDEPLTITLYVIKDIRGVETSDVYELDSTYVERKLTVGGNLLEARLASNITFFLAIDSLLEPTLRRVNNTYMNQYNYSVNLSTEFTNERIGRYISRSNEQIPITITTHGNQSISDDIYHSTSDTHSRRANDSVLVLFYSKEESINIHNGIVEKINYDLEYFTFNTTMEYKINYLGSDEFNSASSLGNFSLFFPILSMIIITITVSFLSNRKISF